MPIVLTQLRFLYPPFAEDFGEEDYATVFRYNAEPSALFAVASADRFAAILDQCGIVVEGGGRIPAIV